MSETERVEIYEMEMERLRDETAVDLMLPLGERGQVAARLTGGVKGKKKKKTTSTRRG
jgi:hypothetical protein